MEREVSAAELARRLSLNYGSILLMALGTQWYILFNVIAGASAVPSDMREAMGTLAVHGRERWRRMILPAVFPAYVTGARGAGIGRAVRVCAEPPHDLGCGQARPARLFLPLKCRENGRRPGELTGTQYTDAGNRSSR